MTTLIEFYDAYTFENKEYNMTDDCSFSDDFENEWFDGKSLEDFQADSQKSYLVCEKEKDTTDKEKILYVFSVEDSGTVALGLEETKEWFKSRRFHYTTDEEIKKVKGENFDVEEALDDDDWDKIYDSSQKQARDFYLKKLENGTFNGFDKFTDDARGEDEGVGEFLGTLEIVGMLKPV